MIHAHGDDGLYMFIRQGIEHHFSVPSCLDQLGRPQDLQLMGDGRLIHLQVIADLSDILFSLKQIIKDLVINNKLN